MATTNDCRSPGSQLLEESLANDNEWRSEADEAIINGIVLGGSGPSSREGSHQASQGAPVKLLTRPVSSGQDPAAGFSFTKAGPIQQLDFRRPKQTPISSTSQDLSLASEGILNRKASHQSPNVPDTAPSNEIFMSTDENLADSNLKRTSESPVLNITFPTRNKPATTLVSGHSLTQNVSSIDQPPANMQERPPKVSRDPVSSVADAPKIAKPRRAKPKVGSAISGPSPPNLAYTEEDLLKLLMYRRRQGQQELEYFRATQHQKEAEIQTLRDLSNDLDAQLQEVIQREAQKTVELSKVNATKPIWEGRIKRLVDYVKGLANDHKRLREDANELYKQHEELFVTKRELQDTLDDARKSVEQQRLRSQQYENDARHRIDSLQQTVQTQSTQIRSDENLLAAERERSNHLDDHISRITTSHGHLVDLFAGHRDTIAGKIDELLHQAQSVVSPVEAADSNDSISPMLEQCVGMLQKLHEADTIKPKDLQKLNDTMDSFVTGVTLSFEAREKNTDSFRAEQKQLALAMQDQLRVLSGNVFTEHALSEQISDLREVKATIRERLQMSESSLADARREVETLRLRDQEQSRRIMALETVAARAKSPTAEASQALLRIQELDSRNRGLQTDIATLNKEAAETSGQLQRNSVTAREVTERLATAQRQLETTREEVPRLREEMSTNEKKVIVEREQLRKELSKAANSQLGSMQSEHMNAIQQLRLERSPVEEKLKSVTREVNMLKAGKENSNKEISQLQALLKGAQIEKGSMQSEHMNTIQQLRLEKSPVEEKLKSVTREVNMLKAGKENFNKEISRLQALLKGAQNEKEAVVGTKKALQLHIKEMETRMHEKNNEYSDIQARLNKAINQVKAKDLEIIALQTKQTLRSSSSRAVEQSPSIRGAQPIRNRDAQHRDSPHVSNHQTPSVRPADRQSSKILANRPAVIEDSQPADKPAFVSLDEIMLDDPFAAYAQEGSQTIASDDVSYLFPSTPGPVSRTKQLEYSRNTVFHSTLVSETQRTQHESFRRSTPHAGSQTADKSHSQSQSQSHTRTRHDHAIHRSSAPTPSTKVTSGLRDINAAGSQREASITRESTQPQGSIKDPRQLKRNAAAAGFNDTDSHAQPSKMQKAEPSKQAKALGPVIEDSQSPLLKGRSRKMMRRKSSGPKSEALISSFWTLLKELVLADKFTRRFAQD